MEAEKYSEGKRKKNEIQVNTFETNQYIENEHKENWHTYSISIGKKGQKVHGAQWL